MSAFSPETQPAPPCAMPTMVPAHIPTCSSTAAFESPPAVPSQQLSVSVGSTTDCTEEHPDWTPVYRQSWQQNPVRRQPAPTPVALPSLDDVLLCIYVLGHRLNLGVDMEDDATPFHSSVVPPMRLDRYAARIVHHCGYGTQELAVALSLLARFTASTGRALTPLTAHRLLLASLHLGAKTTQDLFIANKYMAPIGGVAVTELLWLELSFAEAIGYAAQPSMAEICVLPAALTGVARDMAQPTYAAAGPAAGVQRMKALLCRFAFLPEASSYR